ncbi:MAG: TetR/AcrR family transcriptional regulator [Kofleriaceae bacterium]
MTQPTMPTSPRKKSPLYPPPAPAPGRRDSEAIVQAILDAALGLPPDVAMVTIAKRAGVGEASLYRYFPTQGALHAELTRRFQRQFRDAVKQITETPSLSIEEGIRSICQVGLMLPKEWRRIADLVVPFSWSESHAVEVYGEVLELITAWAARRLPDPPPDLPDRVFIAFASVRGIMIISSMMPARAPNDARLFEHALRTVLDTLQPPKGR